MLPGFISVDVCAPGRIKAHCTVLISDTDYFLAFYERLRCQIQYQYFCVFNFNIFPVLLTCKKNQSKSFQISWKIFPVFCHQTPACEKHRRSVEVTVKRHHQLVINTLLLMCSLVLQAGFSHFHTIITGSCAQLLTTCLQKLEMLEQLSVSSVFSCRGHAV